MTGLKAICLDGKARSFTMVAFGTMVDMVSQQLQCPNQIFGQRFSPSYSRE